ncbi:MAG: rhomboid family intramembrane serine protease [Candidatus Omnitrophica bacterium]|nr:rhomboid family intramembrane serine protease [Candidatus Omnitrophota bacterium]
MIPLRDQAPSRSIPVITVMLIGVNLYVFVRELFLGPGLHAVINTYAVIPANYLHAGTPSFRSIAQNNIALVSALFLHGSGIHVIANMWYLWIFGDNVEDRLGHVRFLIFYIICGVAGNLTHIFMNSRSSIPALGASGCIAGVLGAYFFLFPTARIVTLLPMFIFWTIAEVRAFFFLGIWFLMQFLNGFFMLPTGEHQMGIAWWSHIGGFISGIILICFFKARGGISQKRRR